MLSNFKHCEIGKYEHDQNVKKSKVSGAEIRISQISLIFEV